MKNKLIVGIPAYKNEQQNSFGVGISYLNWVSRFGLPRLIMPHEEFVEDIDLLLIPGGLDLNPSSYGEIPSFKTSNQDVFKQFFFDKRLDNYIGQKPIFGICLGMQELAVKFGSKLTQHLHNHSYYSAPRTELVHKVTIFENGQRIKNPNDPSKFLSVETNSMHHQGVHFKNLSKDLEMIGGIKENDDYLVEVFKHKTLPIAAVQYHPEEIHDNFSISLIKDIVAKNFYYE